MPDILWSDPVPDSNANVLFTFGDTLLKLPRSGYHDTDWGDRSMTRSVVGWYWGRGCLGPYFLVWFYGTDLAGKTYGSSYVAKGDKILSASCKAGGDVTVTQ